TRRPPPAWRWAPWDGLLGLRAGGLALLGVRRRLAEAGSVGLAEQRVERPGTRTDDYQEQKRPAEHRGQLATVLNRQECAFLVDGEVRVRHRAGREQRRRAGGQPDQHECAAEELDCRGPPARPRERGELVAMADRGARHAEYRRRAVTEEQ